MGNYFPEKTCKESLRRSFKIIWQRHKFDFTKAEKLKGIRVRTRTDNKMGILLSQGLCAFLIISISMCHLIFAEEQSNATEEPDIYTKAGVCPHRFHMGCMLDVLEKSCTATQALEGCVNQGNCNQESLGEVGRILGAITKKGEEALWKCCCTKAFEYGYENCKDPNPKCKAALDEEVMKTLKEDRANIKKCMSKPSKDTCKVAMDAVKKV